MGVVAAAAVAAVLGALLPWPAYRLSVAAQEPSRTDCLHCGHLVAGWLRFPPRCRSCRRRIGPQWWVTATVAGAAAAGVAWATGPVAVLAPLVALVVVGTGLAAIDIACHRLPATIVDTAIVVGAGLLLGLAAVTGEWGSLTRALLGAAVLGAVFGLLYLVPGDNLGFGDVRLAVLLGLFLGWLGWSAVVWGALLPWLVNGPVVLFLLATGRATRRTRVPFGPAMLAGALIAIVLSAGVLAG